MQGEPRDILFICQHCRVGAVLEGSELTTVETTALLPAAGHQAHIWRPAWRLDGEFQITSRVRADGMSTPPDKGERTFIIPAFDLPLSSLTRLAQALSVAAAGAGAGEVPAEAIRGGALDREDAVTIARHLMIGEEVRRPDMLASVQVSFNPRESRLAAMPLEDIGGRLRCAVTGVKLPPERSSISRST
jgi:hypothetical protein